jgi:thioredoxin 1
LCECSKNDPTLFFALLGAAGLLAAWMFLRGGLKMKVSNALILIAVVVIVAGVAWFRAAREGSTAGTPTPAVAPVTSPVASARTAPTQKGELCPEPPPVIKAGETPTTGQAPATGPTPPATGEAAAKKLPRVVDLGADKCKACKDLAPILEQLRKEYEGRVTVAFIDVWKNPKAGEPYKIRVIPTQVFFAADGKEVWRHEGFLPKADFIAKFTELGVK